MRVVFLSRRRGEIVGSEASQRRKVGSEIYRARLGVLDAAVAADLLDMRVPAIAGQLDALRGEPCRPAARGMRLVVEIAQIEGQRVALDTGIFQIDRPIP